MTDPGTTPLRRLVGLANAAQREADSAPTDEECLFAHNARLRVIASLSGTAAAGAGDIALKLAIVTREMAQAEDKDDVESAIFALVASALADAILCEHGILD